MNGCRKSISAACVLLTLEYVEYTDGSIAPTSGVNANPPAARTASSQVQRTPGRIADYDPLSEVRPSPYSARQAGATTVIYTSDKGPGEFSSILQSRFLPNFSKKRLALEPSFASSFLTLCLFSYFYNNLSS